MAPKDTSMTKLVAVVLLLAGVSLAQINNQVTVGGNNTLTGTFELKNDPYHDVRAFGAAGDGTTDDTAAIAAAVLASYGASGDHKPVFLPKGTYLVTSQLTLYDAVTPGPTD